VFLDLCLIEINHHQTFACIIVSDISCSNSFSVLLILLPSRALAEASAECVCDFIYGLQIIFFCVLFILSD